uniref:(California timema) hypothetical protein n=1 Tax=Timema californicum TaxID=61474 RepID=A0A7R9JAT0_TIMCA|nr:unnamed protein product [Timema californicum]
MRMCTRIWTERERECGKPFRGNYPQCTRHTISLSLAVQSISRVVPKTMRPPKELMFPECFIAIAFTLGGDKAAYFIEHGSAPFFHNNLLDWTTYYYQSGLYAVICFDEVLNKEQRLDGISPLPLYKLVQVSMITLLQEHITSVTDNELLIISIKSDRRYSSPMASLVLTDSSQLTSDNQHLEMRKVEFKRSVPAFVWRGSGEPFKKNRFSPLDWDSNLDLPVISRPVQRGSDALDHAATEAGSRTVVTILATTARSVDVLFALKSRIINICFTKPSKIYGNSMWSSLKEHQL